MNVSASYIFKKYLIGTTFPRIYLYGGANKQNTVVIVFGRNGMPRLLDHLFSALVADKSLK